MSTTYKWYDPVCYQFFFYAISQKEDAPAVAEAYQAFVEELAPCFAAWLSQEGRLLSETRKENATCPRVISDEKELHEYSLSLTKGMMQQTDGLELCAIPGNTLTRFAAPARTIDKTWKEQVLRYTDYRLMETIDRSELFDWLYQTLNCPSDDLSQVCFPKRCFNPQDVPLSLSYQRWSTESRLAYLWDILQESGLQDSDDSIYFHRMHVSIPRFIFAQMNTSFSFQKQWTDRLMLLCGSCEKSVAYMKMDAYTPNNKSPLMTGNGSFLPCFSRQIPDTAWAMCLTKEQISVLGGLDELQNSRLFHRIEPLSGGAACLQLTPDISIVPRSKAEMQWQRLAPHLKLSPINIQYVSDIPMSFRLGLERSQLILEDFGQYKVAP